MKLPLFQVDAFAGRLFAGNPAAVVILPEWLPAETLQAIAAENNLAETAFVVPRGERFGLRWFTPAVEIDLCGHATLASAHVLLRCGYAPGREVIFDYQGGELRVAQKGELLVMDFPARPALPIPHDPAIGAALGAAPSEVFKSRDLMAVFESRDAVAKLAPDFAALAALDAMAVIATAPGGDCDYVSRFFAPRVGIAEDPATGSAQCTLVPYWSKRLGKRELHSLQLSRRVGEFFCEDRGPRVAIAGRVFEYLHGEIVV